MRVGGCVYRASHPGDLPISPGDVKRFAATLPGARVLVEHDPLARCGTVHDAFVAPNGDLGVILDIPFLPPNMDELSLRHDEFGKGRPFKGPTEISIVRRGARPGTVLFKSAASRSESTCAIMASAAATPETDAPPEAKRPRYADAASDVILKDVMDKLGTADGELASALVDRFGSVANKAASSLEELKKAKDENARLADENAKFTKEREAVEAENRMTSKKIVESFSEMMKTLAPEFAMDGEDDDSKRLRETYERELQNSALMRAMLSHVPVAASAASQLKKQTHSSLRQVAEVERRVSEMGGALTESAPAPAPADDQSKLLATLKKLSQF